MPNGLLILAAFLLYGLFVYGPRLIGRKRKIIGEPYKIEKHAKRFHAADMDLFSYRNLWKPIQYFDGGDTLREVNARRGQ